MPLDATWFASQRALLALERDAAAARIALLHETLSLEQRVARGIALANLEAVDDRVGLGGRVLVELEYPSREALSTRISVGDIVRVTPRRTQSDEALASVTAVVSRRARTRLTVSLDEPPPPWLREGRVLVELQSDEVTFQRARAVVDQVETLREPGAERRRELLLGRVTPYVGRRETVVHPPTRNPEQRDAIERALAAEELYLLHGPPGTGKTTALVAYVAAEVARGRRVLCLAPSNAAVDNLVERLLGAGLDPVRLGHPARVSEALHPYTLDARVEAHPSYAVSQDLFAEAYELLGYARRQRQQGRSASRGANARAAKGEAYGLLKEARALERQTTDAMLSTAKVLCATCSGAAGPDLQRSRFDVAVVDEATQSIEALAMAAFLRAPKVVLAGDHKQLGPTVISTAALEGGLGVSLFERLVDAYGDVAKTMLREQHRMHASIMRFASDTMYGGELRAHPAVATRTLDAVLTAPETVDAPPVIFLDTAGKGFTEEAPADMESLQNPGEAALVLGQAKRLVDAGLDPSELAIIAPYAAQVAFLRAEATVRGVPDAVEIDTVDAFQGREKDAVLVTTVRSNDDGTLGFLNDLRRMNVALTRPRRHLFVVGDLATLAANPYFARFADHAAACGGERSAWAWAEEGD